MRRVVIIPLLLGLLGVSCIDDGDDASPARLYYVQDGVMRDRDGHVLLLRSVNFSGQAKGTDDHLFPFTSGDIDTLLSSGINSVRMLTFWKGVTPDAPGEVDQGYVDAFVAQVDQLAAAGLYVVVDMHQDLWGVPFAAHGAPAWACPPSVTAGYESSGAWWTNYATPQVSGCFDLFWEDLSLQQDFIDAWTALASAVCHQERVVGFDLMNEPYPGSALFDETWDNAVLMPFYERVSDAIEVACPGRLYFVEHSAGFVIGWAEPLVVAEELRDRMVYAGHFYPQEIHESSGAGYDGDAAAMAQQVWRYVGTHVENSTAVWVGEYGGMTNSTSFDLYMRDLHTIYASHNISTALWDYYRSDGGFSLLDGAGALKPVFDAVYLTPMPTLLPSPPMQVPDWENRAITLDFDCVVGRSVTVLLPTDGCHCEATPSDALEPLGGDAGFVNGACLRDAPVTLDCGCVAPSM